MSEKDDYQPPYAPPKPQERAVAVALAADKDNPDAPAKMVAVGRGLLAEQIIQMAFANGVKVRTDSDLAELLAQLELDTPIPTEAIVVVAEILAKVYQANNAIASSTPPLDPKGKS